ncbi:hypothetical protein L209DRAFT_808113 [Thermothelomyces heterothallicus CBS 203.75]
MSLFESFTFRWLRWCRPTAPLYPLPSAIERFFVDTPGGEIGMLYARPQSPPSSSPSSSRPSSGDDTSEDTPRPFLYFRPRRHGRRLGVARVHAVPGRASRRPLLRRVDARPRRQLPPVLPAHGVRHDDAHAGRRRAGGPALGATGARRRAEGGRARGPLERGRHVPVTAVGETGDGKRVGAGCLGARVWVRPRL